MVKKVDFINNKKNQITSSVNGISLRVIFSFLAIVFSGRGNPYVVLTISSIILVRSFLMISNNSSENTT